MAQFHPPIAAENRSQAKNLTHDHLPAETQ